MNTEIYKKIYHNECTSFYMRVPPVESSPMVDYYVEYLTILWQIVPTLNMRKYAKNASLKKEQHN